MDLNDIFPKGFSFGDALDLVRLVSLYVLGMSAYALFIFRFYRFVATRDMFRLDMSRYEQSRHPWIRTAVSLALYFLKYILLFPVAAFFWFAILTLLLTYLTTQESFGRVLLIALSTVSAIRVTAYFREDLSRELARILPFAVLGTFIVDAPLFDFTRMLDLVEQGRDFTEEFLYYLAFLLALEFVLRIAMRVVQFSKWARERLRRKVQGAQSEDEMDVSQLDQGSDSQGGTLVRSDSR